MASASADPPLDGLLASLTLTPIAQLDPSLPNLPSRAVRGEVTITWPYNRVRNTFAFLLAEPDVRLRRAKGQVRVELHGPAAKAVADCGLGGGDQVQFSLDGADWAKDESPGRIPGARVDWQIQFSERLVLQVKLGESGELKHIDIDHPGPELPVPPPLEQAPADDIALPEVDTPLPQGTPRAPRVAELAPNEYASPAFMKRARLSYGALFEDGLDIFEEDGGVKGKGRKRSRFGRESNAWRYSSQSPSPEPSSPVRDVMDEDGSDAPAASPKPLMMDEGVQTMGLDTIPTPESNEPAEPVMAPAPIPVMTEPVVTPAPIQATTQPATTERATTEPSPVPLEPRGLQSEPSQQDVQDKPVPDAQHEASDTEHAPSESRATNQTQPDIHPTTQDHAEPIPAHQEIPTTLFGTPKPVNPFSMFGTAAPTRIEPGFNLADQVRFGFSHIPQTTHVPKPPSDHGMSGFDHHGSASYPEAFLNPPGPVQYANMDPYADLPEHNQVGESVDDTQMLMEQPLDSVGRAEWEVPAQSQYESLDGLRFAPPALDTETEFFAEQHAYPFGVGSPAKVPEGFSSYGDPAHGSTLYSEDDGEDEDEETSSPSRRPPVRHNDFVQNDETFDASQEAVAVDDDDDSIATDSNGEELEEGDYDQRRYDAPQDDEEGIPEEFNEEYDDEAVYDEDDIDGEGSEEDGGEEEDYDSESQDEDVEPNNFSAQPMRKPAPASSAPVYIDLISDSEEDDEPAPVPTRRAPSPKNAQAATPSQPPNPQADFIDPMLARAAAMAQDEVDKQALDGAQHLDDSHDRIQVVDFAHEPSSTRDDGVQESVEDVDSSSDEATQQSWGEPYALDGESSKDGLFVKQPRGQVSEEEDESGDAHSSGDESDAGSVEGAETYDQDVDDDADMDVVGIDDQSENDVESGEDVEIGDASEADEEEEAQEYEDEDNEGEEEHQEDAVATSGPYSSKSPNLPGDAMEIDQEPAEVDDDDSESKQLEQQLWGETDDHSPSESALATVPAEEDEQSENEPAGSRAATPVQQDMVVEEVTVEEVTVEEEVTIEETFIVEQRQTLEPPASFEQIVGGPSQRTVAETEPSFQFSTQEHRASSPEESADEQPAPEPKTTPTRQTRRMRLRSADVAENVEADGPVATQSQAHLDADEQPAPELKATPTRQTRRMRLRSADVAENVEADGSVAAQPQAYLDADEQPAPELKATPTRQTRRMRLRSADVAENVEAHDSAAQPQAHLDADEAQVDNGTKAIGTPASVDMDRSSRHDVDSQASPSQKTRATREKSAAALELPKLNDTRDDGEEQTAAHNTRRTRSSNAPPSPSVVVPSTPDISVKLARQSVAAKLSKKAPPEPLRSSPIVTRARSSSLQTSPHSPEFEDNSVRLARAALDSPSRAKHNPEPEAGTTASLKADLTKNLRSFRECISLKSLRNHVDEHPNVLAVVTSTPAEPVRAKGGPREFVMSFTVTDPSMAPTHVVEVQLYRPHKESLPVVQPGDAILLQKFQVKALSNKGFGLRSHTESAWAVFDVDDGPPQIKGPPIEDYDQYGDHCVTLRAWYASMDEAAKGKLEKASKKFEEAGMGK